MSRRRAQPSRRASRPGGPASPRFAAARPPTNRTGMPAPLLASMEGYFGESFSDVRVRRDSREAVELSAMAFTRGDEIHFAPGRWQPGTHAGRALLGHELTHVGQQRRGRVKPTVRLATGHELNDSSRLEGEAERRGEKAARAAALPGVGASRIPGTPLAGAGLPARSRFPEAGSGPARPSGPVQRSAEDNDQLAQAVTDQAVEGLDLFYAGLAIDAAYQQLYENEGNDGNGGNDGNDGNGGNDGDGGDGAFLSGRKRGRQEADDRALLPGERKGARRRFESSRKKVEEASMEVVQTKRVVQRAAVATGFKGGQMDRKAATPVAHGGPGGANIAFPAMKAFSNTSRGVDTTDLHRQAGGGPVGATRPNDWAKFRVMARPGWKFVQGHSLSQKLGGKGQQKNLSPFTRSLNGLHSNRVEQEIIDHTRAAGADEYADYKVEVVYGGNPGLTNWCKGQFTGTTQAKQRQSLVAGGFISALQAAAYKKAGAIPAAKINAGRDWIDNYVNGTFPKHIKCKARFIDSAAGQATAYQNVKITNAF